MPFVPVEHPKCPKCDKSVYAAEERIAGGHKWHKMCFKCEMCGKFLDSTNCAEHDKELYCKNCHGRKYGPKGYGFGGGAGCLSTDTGDHLAHVSVMHRPAAPLESRAIARAPEGEGCPRCGGYVYMAEQMLAKGRGYHKECFNCISCHKTLNSVIHCDGPNNEVYCRVCYSKRFGPRGIGHSGTGGQSIGLTCDLNDEIERDVSTSRAPVVDTTSIKAKPGQGCPRCGGVVFAAEQVLAKGSEWHKKCFKCKDCNKTLDSIIACDGPDRDVYCKTCYGKKWGPHGYGFACGSGFLQTDGLTEDQISASRPFYSPNTTSILAPEGEGCPRCGGKVFAAEQQLAKGTMWHKICFNCAACHRPLDSTLACDGPDREIYCRSCYGKYFGPKGFGYGHSPTLISTKGENTILFPESRPTSGIKSRNGKGCPRCGYEVYAAEQMISKNKVWHRRCFTCGSCSKSLDSTNLTDGPDADIYCKACYSKHFGPKGCGFGIGAGALTMT
ncbi:muscle LIM protein Mlp84B-like isoform X1 [Daktulosphaira vitifoliae]|uniref:muscle LIM protein Mlp84B-like isoform X1 n=1 Tax=Daktulosphaira vitifoliae TaxID=58002 RepID=UPI0021AAD528|nr:muscle LIM protein Mlp84B-like isoform X1 [Daktulosphaira vitifoliae]